MSGIIKATNLQVANIKDTTGTNTAITVASDGTVSGIATTLTEQATTRYNKRFYCSYNS